MVPMYIERVPNRGSRPAVLLREGWREGNRVRKRTVANLSDWPEAKVEALGAVLRGEAVGGRLEEAFEVVRSRPHGHVVAVVGTMHQLKLPALLEPRRSRKRELATALIAARIVDPQSKLATARQLDPATECNTLGELLGLEHADEDELYAAMDWLLQRQPQIEQALAARHLRDGTLMLYDVTSSYFEGRSCPLARLGHSRDGKKGKLQIVVGLLCSAEGCPVAVEVFEGNTGDPMTLGSQIRKVRERFGLERVVFVGDRGMITDARIRNELRPVEGLDWITALRSSSVAKLVEQGNLQPSLFDEHELGEITSPDYPGERLVVCKNPQLADERARKRQELLQRTEQELERIAAATRRSKRRLKGKDKIGLRVGKVLERSKVGKHFHVDITDDGLSYSRDEQAIQREAALDGLYVVRTSVPQDVLDAQDTVRAYKSLSAVERAFRSCKTVDLKIRPIHHRLEDRVRAHVFICMLAYYVEWHIRDKLAPMLFDDDDPQGAEALRTSPVQSAQRSADAQRKAHSKRTSNGQPVHSLQTLLRDLATLSKHRIQPTLDGMPPFDRTTRPTPLQQQAFDLLEVDWTRY